MYDFDIKKMLAAFNDDPEALADAFARSLNDELAQQRSIRALKNTAADVAVAWNDFVEEYFELHDIPANTTLEDYQLFDDGECLIKLLETFVQYGPDIEKWVANLRKISDAATKLNDNLEKMNIKIPESNFDQTMKKFFKEMGW